MIGEIMSIYELSNTPFDSIGDFSCFTNTSLFQSIFLICLCKMCIIKFSSVLKPSNLRSMMQTRTRLCEINVDRLINDNIKRYSI